MKRSWTLAIFAPVFFQVTIGAAGSAVEERLADCYMSDDSVIGIYEGDLPAGQSLDLTFDWCAFDDVVMKPGGYWEGAFDGLAVDFSGKGQLVLEVTEDGVHQLAVHPQPPPKHGYVAWQRCATYHNRVNLTGTSDGFTTVRVTNTGTRSARDLSMAIHIGTNHSGFLDAHCPFTEDWGI